MKTNTNRTKQQTKTIQKQRYSFVEKVTNTTHVHTKILARSNKNKPFLLM